MAKNKPAVAGDAAPPATTSPVVKKPRGPRGIKLALPPTIQKQLNDLPELYPKLKQADAQSRFMALLSPSLEAAYQSSLDQLINVLESERAAKVSALRNLPQQATESVAPDPDDPNYVDYVALDDATAQ